MERLFFILRLLILLMTWVGSVLFITVIYMQPSLTMNSNEKLLSYGVVLATATVLHILINKLFKRERTDRGIIDRLDKL